MRKPKECFDCPWYGDGEGFVPDFNLARAQVVFVLQNPGGDEELVALPAIGRTGQILRGFVAQYLAACRVGYANIVKCRRQGADGRRSNEMPKPRTKEWKTVVDYCTSRHLKLPADALIVACGDHAAAFLAPELEGPELHIRGSFIA